MSAEEDTSSKQASYWTELFNFLKIPKNIFRHTLRCWQKLTEFQNFLVISYDYLPWYLIFTTFTFVSAASMYQLSCVMLLYKRHQLSIKPLLVIGQMSWIHRFYWSNTEILMKVKQFNDFSPTEPLIIKDSKILLLYSWIKIYWYSLYQCFHVGRSVKMNSKFKEILEACIMHQNICVFHGVFNSTE